MTLKPLRASSPQLHSGDPYEEAVNAIELELTVRDVPRRFSPEAELALHRASGEFIEELGQEAIRIAARDRTHDVAEAHVQLADARIRSGETGRSRLPRILEAVGALLAGVGGGEWVDVVTDASPDTTAFVLSTVLLLVGAVMFSTGLVRDLIRDD